MIYKDLPPLPPPGARGTLPCSIIRLYLAVEADLTLAQRQIINSHLEFCPDCSQERRQLQRVNYLLGNMSASQPSTAVDEAVAATIRTRVEQRISYAQRPRHTRRHAAWSVSGLAAVALLLLALLSNLHIFPWNTSAFALPQQVNWNNYVLYQQQTMQTSSGERYQVSSYHDLMTNRMHVETRMNGELDVIAIGDEHEVLGMDEMHHVAQWDAQIWCQATNMFQLAQLRSDLQSGRAVYEGQQTYQGQQVYRIRTRSGDILLLNMQYMPVNILQAGSQQNEKPLFDVVHWLSPSQVPTSLWNMQVPANFTMGQLPQRP